MAAQRPDGPGRPFADVVRGSEVGTGIFTISGTGFVALSRDWKEYSIEFRDSDLSYVLGGFGWATNAIVNGMRDVTFYIDDVRYELGYVISDAF